MIRLVRSAATGASIAVAGLFSCAESAKADWGCYPETSYYHAPIVGGYYGHGYRGSVGRRYSLHSENFGYSSYFNPSYAAYEPSYGYGAPLPSGLPGYGDVPGYGVSPYDLGGSGLVRPRGRMKYDVYTPYGKQEVEYRFRRNGRIDVDIDD